MSKKLTFWAFFANGPAVQYEAYDAEEAAERYAEIYNPTGVIHVVSDTRMFRRKVSVQPSQAQTVEGPGYRVTLPQPITVPEK
jgi:hypothetical protein